MTTQINLLPWRAQLREEQKKQFIIFLLGAISIAAVIVGLVYIVVQGKIKDGRKVNAYIETETRILDQKLASIQEINEQRQELIARRQVLQQLQIERVAIVNILQGITERLPDGVFLTEIKKQGDQLTLTGKAESNTRVSELMQKIESSSWIIDPLLTIIKSDNNKNVHIRDFKITMTVYLPPVSTLQTGGQHGSE